MEANAPEKIYRRLEGKYIKYYDYKPAKISYDEKEPTEYTRTDAFIEKAAEFLDGCIPDYIDLEHANVDTFMNVDNKRFIDEFRKYIKGE